MLGPLDGDAGSERLLEDLAFGAAKALALRGGGTDGAVVFHEQEAGAVAPGLGHVAFPGAGLGKAAHALAERAGAVEGSLVSGEVVRGADLAESTPRQILLARLLRLPVPSYVHVPLVLARDGSRLAKRDQAATLAGRGGSPAATLTLLASTLGYHEPVTSATGLLDGFEPQRIPLEPVVIEAGL